MSKKRREFDRIDWIRNATGARRTARVPVPLGDDGCAIMPTPGHAVVLSVDAAVDSVHFRGAWAPLDILGARAVDVSISDLAAMGAKPRGLLASLQLPRDFDERSFRRLETGILDAGASYGAPVLGGNLSSGELALHITAIGECAPARLLRREGGRTGDVLWVSGTPGLASLGRLGLEQQTRKARRRKLSRSQARSLRAATERWLRPRARVELGAHLSKTGCARGAIDVSDGLASDLGQLLQAGNRRAPSGATIDARALLNDDALSAAASALRTDPLAAALYGGEDYELLFVGPASLPSTTRRLAARLGIRLTSIGTLTSGTGAILIDADGNRKRLDLDGGWDHFAGC